MASFEDQIKAFAKKTNARAESVVRKIVFGVYSELDSRSPVGDGKYWKSPPPPGYVGGRFRANWQYGHTAMPTGELDTTDYASRPAEVKGEISNAQADGVHWLVNNVPYAVRIEDGWSRQAPQGVVGLTVTRWKRIAEEAVRGQK